MVVLAEFICDVHLSPRNVVTVHTLLHILPRVFVIIRVSYPFNDILQAFFPSTLY
jgi:hypothetical protein